MPSKYGRVYKQDYIDLFNDPSMYIEGATVKLFPNGEKGVIWVQTEGGYGFEIKLSRGPVGLGMEVRAFIGTPKLTAWGENVEDSEAPRGRRNQHVDDNYHSMTQYFNTERAEKFKAWYAGETAEYPEVVEGEQAS